MLAKYLTSDVHSSERFEFWRDAVCDAFVRLGCTTDVRKEFFGSLNVKRYQDLSVSHVTGSSHEVFRRKRDIARAQENDFLLSLQLHNHSRLVQHANTATLQRMDFAMYSSTDPYQLSLSQDFSQLVLQFPKAKLLSRLPNAEMLTGIRIDGSQPLSALVAKNIIDLTNMMDSQPESAQILMQETLLDMIAMALAATANSRVDISLPEQQFLLRARTFIHANLGDETLNRDRVAKAVGISVRRLNEVFAKEDMSISSLIRTSRLEQVAADLIDPRFTGQTISELASKWGFSSFQHFSKLFRRTYNMSPKAYRGSNHSGASGIN